MRQKLASKELLPGSDCGKSVLKRAQQAALFLVGHTGPEQHNKMTSWPSGTASVSSLEEYNRYEKAKPESQVTGGENGDASVRRTPSDGLTSRSVWQRRGGVADARGVDFTRIFGTWSLA